MRRVAGFLFACLTAATVGAVPIRLVATTSSGEVVLDHTTDLAPGEERRLAVPPAFALADRVGRFYLTAALSLAAGGDPFSIGVTGILRPVADGEPVIWTGRTLTLRAGERATFVAEPAVSLSFTIEVGADNPALPAVHLATLVRVREDGPRGRGVVSQREVRLVGPDATAVYFQSEEAALPALVVHLRPRSRDDVGAVLDMDVERPSAPPADPVSGRRRLALGWGDIVRIGGFHGPGGSLSLEIELVP